MPAPRDTLHASVSGGPTLVHTPAGVTPDARIVDPNAPTIAPLAAEPSRAGFARTLRQEDSPAPAAIGRFTVLRELGRGGTGVVYAAYDEQLDRKVAVKLLHSETREDLARTRLLREAQAMARLSHPNIVGVHEVGTFGRQVYVAMEFVHGVTLHAWLKRRHRDFAEVVALFRQAGEGLAAAHAAGLVHRDFKPANVMVGDDGRVRVLDFGLARVEASPGAAPGLDDLEPAGEHASAVANLRSLDASITVTGVMLGTPAYMAAEQFLGVRVDARSDQFAFCVALFEAAYNARPFPGDTLAELMARVLTGQVRDVPTPPGVPRGLRPLLLRGLQRQPEDRWPAMRPLLDALAPFARRRVRRTWAAAAAGLAALCVGGGFGIGFHADVLDPTCSGGAERIAGAWNDDVRERLAAVARDSGLPEAEAAWERAAAAFDDYAERWIDAHGDSCDDTDPLLDLRMSCLAERRNAFATAIGMYAHLDADLLAHSDQLIASLPNVDACAEDEYLLAKVRPPDDPKVRAQVDALRTVATEAVTKEQGGQFDQALELLLPAIAAAPPSYPQLRAELGLLEGSLREQLGEYEDARVALAAAFFYAVESGHIEVVVDAATRLAYVVGRRLGDGQTAEDWLRHAEIYAERHGDPLRRARVRVTRGALANSRMLPFGREELLAQSRESFRAAHRLFQEARKEKSVDYARYLRFHGDHLAATGSVASAIEMQKQALELMRARVGDNHPDVAMIYNSLGIALMDDRQLEAALAQFRAGLAASVDLPNQRNHVYMTLWFNMSGTLRDLGRYAEAEKPLREAMAVLERSSKRLLHETVVLQVELARLLDRLGRGAEAEADLRAMMVRADQIWAPRDPMRMDSLLMLSKLRLAAGEPREALAIAEQALEMALQSPHPGHKHYAKLVGWHIARALAELGQRPRALALAEEARAFAVARGDMKDGEWIAEIDAFRRKLLAAQGAPP